MGVRVEKSIVVQIVCPLSVFLFHSFSYFGSLTRFDYVALSRHHLNITVRGLAKSPRIRRDGRTGNKGLSFTSFTLFMPTSPLYFIIASFLFLCCN